MGTKKLDDEQRDERNREKREHGREKRAAHHGVDVSPVHQAHHGSDGCDWHGRAHGKHAQNQGVAYEESEYGEDKQRYHGAA